MRKVILTDCDGVLLNYLEGFEKYVESLGYVSQNDHNYDFDLKYGITKELAYDLIKSFNTTSLVGKLEPFKDSVEYIKKFKDDGWEIIVITSFGTDAYSMFLRQQNLDDVFGKDTFKLLICLEQGSKKYDILKEYSNTGYPWIEDHVENCEDGLRLGLNSFLINQDYNQHSIISSDIKRINSWKDIYEELTKNA